MMMNVEHVIRNARIRFDALPSNDRRALLVMFAVVGLLLVYLSLSMSRQYQKSAITQYKTMKENVAWIAVNIDALKQVSAAEASSKNTAPAVAQSSDASLINIATTTAKPLGITFKRFQPEGDNGLRLWIEAAEFDKLLRWIVVLKEQDISLDQLDVDRLEKQQGMVDARILVSRTP
ncbi:MAG TPA: type II secretion system protein GspM [Pseudomonadales bacterium]|nr:type II secretion system protein GspM [Pseudomonadales bacterium]